MSLRETKPKPARKHKEVHRQNWEKMLSANDETCQRVPIPAPSMEVVEVTLCCFSNRKIGLARGNSLFPNPIFAASVCTQSIPGMSRLSHITGMKLKPNNS